MQKVLARHIPGTLPEKEFSVFAWDILPKGNNEDQRGEWEKISLVGEPAKENPILKKPEVPPAKPAELTQEETRRAKLQAEAEEAQRKAAEAALNPGESGNGAENTQNAVKGAENTPEGDPETGEETGTAANPDYRELVESAKEALAAGKKENARDLFLQAEKISPNNWIKGQLNKLNEEIGE